MLQKLIQWWDNYCFHIWKYDHDSTYDYERECIRCGKKESGDNK